jgi:hypothetical protein
MKCDLGTAPSDFLSGTEGLSVPEIHIYGNPFWEQSVPNPWHSTHHLFVCNVCSLLLIVASLIVTFYFLFLCDADKEIAAEGKHLKDEHLADEKAAEKKWIVEEQIAVEAKCVEEEWITAEKLLRKSV